MTRRCRSDAGHSSSHRGTRTISQSLPAIPAFSWSPQKIEFCRAFSDMDKLDRSLDSIIGSSRHGPSRNSYGGQSRKIWRLCLSCSGGSRRNGRRENRQAKPYTRAAERGGRTVINTSSGEQSEHKVRSPGDAVPVARQPIDLPYPAQVSGQTPPKMLAGLIAARVRLAA